MGRVMRCERRVDILLRGILSEVDIAVCAGLALSQGGTYLYVTDQMNKGLRKISIAGRDNCIVETLDYAYDNPEDGFAPLPARERECCAGATGNMHESILYLGVKGLHQVIMVNFEKEQALSILAGNGAPGNAFSYYATQRVVRGLTCGCYNRSWSRSLLLCLVFESCAHDGNPE